MSAAPRARSWAWRSSTTTWCRGAVETHLERAQQMAVRQTTVRVKRPGAGWPSALRCPLLTRGRHPRALGVSHRPSRAGGDRRSPNWAGRARARSSCRHPPFRLARAAPGARAGGPERKSPRPSAAAPPTAATSPTRSNGTPKRSSPSNSITAPSPSCFRSRCCTNCSRSAAAGSSEVGDSGWDFSDPDSTGKRPAC